MAEEESDSKLATTWRNLRSQALSSSRLYYDQMRKRTRKVSWLTFGFGFGMVFGIIFFIMGLVWLTNGETDDAKSWVFFSLGICLILFALCLLLIKCVLPHQVSRRPRSTHRHHHRRHRPREPRQQTTVWSTSTLPTSRPETAAPPSYEEAVGGSRASRMVEQLPPPYFGGQPEPGPRSTSMPAAAARLL